MDAQSRLEIALERIQHEIQRSQTALDEKLELAARLPDGTHAFKDQNGTVRCEDGSQVSDDLAATIIWSGNEPELEEIQADRQRLQRLDVLADDVRSGQAEIGDMQARMDDNDDPASSNELDGFKARAEEIVDGVEKRLEVETQRSAPSVAESSVETTAELEVPKL